MADTINNTLKPCPFCGGEAEYMQGGPIFTVVCLDDDCPMSGSWSYRSEEDAAKAWNTRNG